jgi:hypothetical protein
MSPYWRSNALAEAADGSWPFLLDEAERTQEFAQALLAAADVPPAFVLDLGITAEHGWAIVEGNPCWGAGLYGCDPGEALLTARNAIRKMSEISSAEKHWISPRIHARLN